MKIRFHHVVLLAIVIGICLRVYSLSAYRYDRKAAPKIKAYYEQMQEFQDFRDEEGYVRDTEVIIKDEPSKQYKGLRYITVSVEVQLSGAFEKISPAKQCQWLYKYSKMLEERKEEIREASGYKEVLRESGAGYGTIISDYCPINFLSPVYQYMIEDSNTMRVIWRGAIGYVDLYSFRVRDGKAVDVREVRYSSSGRSSSSGKSSSSGRSSSSGSYGNRYWDSYDVEDYDDPDDFADDWADDFADLVDGDYEDGYDEAYEYWEENH